MLTFCVMSNLFSNGMNRKQLFMHEQRLEWNHLEEAIKAHQVLRKPPLVKLVYKLMLQIFGISRWVMGCIFRNASSLIEKDEVLINTIFQCKLSYVKRAKVVWNVTLWEQESNKSIKVKDMQAIIDFHALEDDSWIMCF